MPEANQPEVTDGDQDRVIEREAQNPQELATWIFNTFSAEINTPLTIVGGNADLLDSLAKTDPEYDNVIEEVTSGSIEAVTKIGALQRALQDASKGKPLKLIEQTTTGSGQPEFSIHLTSYKS